MKKQESGFTLIEIVMVLVLLGILAAVAIPKYYDLQQQAVERAADAVVAEYQSQLNGAFANGLLEGTAIQGQTLCATAKQAAIDSLAEGQMVKTAGLESVNLAKEANGKIALTLTIRGISTKSDGKALGGDLVVPSCFK